MSIDINAPQFSLATIAEAAGILPATLTTWRNRHELFADTVTGTKERKFFSLADACVARAVFVLTKHGLDTPDAIWFADSHMRAQITILLAGEEFSSLVGFYKPERGKERIAFIVFPRSDAAGELIDKTPGVLTVVNVMTIIKHVVAALKVPTPEGWA